MNNEIQCPKCSSTKITANKKGYSLIKGVAGVALTGGIGLLGGLFGRNKIEITCLTCGNKFKPGEGSIINDESVSHIPELYVEENADLKNDVLDIFIENLKKDALFAEFNSDFEGASHSWNMYLSEMMQSNKECDLKAIKNAVNCYRKTNNVIREFFLYEDLITNYPNHPDVEIWKNYMGELKLLM